MFKIYQQLNFFSKYCELYTNYFSSKKRIEIQYIRAIKLQIGALEPTFGNLIQGILLCITCFFYFNFNL